jgi:hypothetical protein
MYLVPTIHPTALSATNGVTECALVPRSETVRGLAGRQLTILPLIPESNIAFLNAYLKGSLLTQQNLATNQHWRTRGERLKHC